MPTRRLKALRSHAPARRGAVHPTKEKLLQSTLALMQRHRVEEITADMVLEHSGISRGSMYHHFADFPDLLEQALVHRFAQGVDLRIEALRLLIESSSSKEDAFARLRLVTQETNARSRALVRFERARLLGHAQDNPRLADRLGIEQARLTGALADLFREFQARGWMRTDFDPHAAAVFIQAYTLGKVVDDVVPEKMSEEGWNDLIGRIAESVFKA